jgi:hypothetical protein
MEVRDMIGTIMEQEDGMEDLDSSMRDREQDGNSVGTNNCCIIH